MAVTVVDTSIDTAPRRSASAWSNRALDRAPFLVACLMLAVIVAIYGSLQAGVFTIDELNLDTAAATTLMLAARQEYAKFCPPDLELAMNGKTETPPMSNAPAWPRIRAGGFPTRRSKRIASTRRFSTACPA